MRIFTSFWALGLAVACSSTTQSTEPAADPLVVAPSDSAPPASTAPAPSKTGPQGAMCGGIAGFGCAVGLYCSFTPEATCGAADMTGICQPVAEMCTEEYRPVCGCNDKTYPNACHAAREGISVGRAGECPLAQPAPDASAPPAAGNIPEGKLCGTRGVPGECAAGLYCQFKSSCGETDSGEHLQQTHANVHQDSTTPGAVRRQKRTRTSAGCKRRASPYARRAMPELAHA